MSAAAPRRALVTGGASGIGFEVARRLAADGAAVALLDLDPGTAAAAAARVGSDAVAVAADVRSAEAVAAAVGEATAALGGLDTLVCSAGTIHVKPLAEVTDADWDLTLDVNLKGVFLCCQAAAPTLAASGRGRIAIVSSDAAKRGAPRLAAYSASKAGTIGLARALAAELAPAVTVNCVCPVGVPATGMGRELLELKASETGASADEVLADIARDLPMGRNATPADVAAAVAYLTSDAAGFVTGVALDVDGGSALGFIPGVD